MIDAYKILGVSKDADENAVKKAFRKLAKQYHPDTCKDPQAEAKFKEVNEAQRILNDPEEKMKHDIENGYVARPRGQNPFGSGFPFGGGGIDDFFNEMFGSNPFGGHARAHRHGAHRQLMNIGIELTLEEIYSGVTKTLSINGRRLEVDIPAGCENGEVFAIDMEDMQLRLQIQEVRHPTVERSGLDLYKEIRLPLDIAVLGGEQSVELLGAIKKVTVPPQTGSHKTIRIRGAGITAEGNTGDLYLVVRVDINDAAIFQLKRRWS